ncbi:DoxX family membrane protein [Stutzerimonas kirkiae]|uniref:DoxX family membrane protein n=1 Tax=Stutzerimonas kirkiae TaxID=2211392 RepID=UPI003BF9FF56
MRPCIDNALDSRWLWITARILLAVVFLSSGLAKLIDFQGGLAEMRAAGLEPDWLFNIATIVVLLGGSVLLLLDRALWLGAGALALFLLLTIAVVHRFWALPEPQAKEAMFWALEHTTVVGGLIAAAIASRLRRRLGGGHERAHRFTRSGAGLRRVAGRLQLGRGRRRRLAGHQGGAGHGRACRGAARLPWRRRVGSGQASRAGLGNRRAHHPHRLRVRAGGQAG